ncbi:MAG: tRNA uridine-5-carboxymethylaminomethyl(34) synthesis GTPase MnmE, partial [Candidatus Cloacimonetes bacterium]|nr:tRNA uridine-5-carboxymethylaminomethyl(34) synthesis GTPase MnmE [Candidatus Cloacimonadota bacterium]
MNYQNDTICAISTPPGISGIAVIRISGAEAIKTADCYFKGRRKLQDCSSHTVHFGHIVDGDEILDEVYAMIFRTPHSYTGEDVVEISCHGNTFVANRILQLLLRKIRLAGPGEFTQRAFFNDKIDLTRAEAIADLLQAQTRRSHRAAVEQLEGSLYRRIELLVQKLTDYRTRLELEIDFLEQSIPEINLGELEGNLLGLLAELKQLVASGEEGIILREGLRVSLVGAPNVGKSSIFNAFLESERAIVTPIPGTTRDYLEEAISLQGYLVRIFDTAGIRPAGDQIEQIGIDRSYDIIKKSHLVLFI